MAARRALTQQRRDTVARPRPHRAVKKSPSEQEEQQHGGAVEIGMFAADNGFEQADRHGQHHPDRNRHVHVGGALAQRRKGAGKERPPGIGDGRQRDQRRQPVEERAGGALRARPDRHRQQHDVHCGKAGDAQRLQQPPGFGVFGGCQIAAELFRDKAQPFDRQFQAVVIERRIMRDADPPRGEIDPRRCDTRQRGQAAFQLGNATGAAQPFDGKDAGCGAHAGTSSVKSPV